MRRAGELPLPTRDPFGRGPVVVTALEGVASGVRIEGRFSLGWMGRLTREQLDLVGLLLARRNNLQQLAADLGISYNTVRARFDDIVAAIGAVPGASPEAASAAGVGAANDRRRALLDRLAAGDVDVDAAEQELRDLT